MTNLKNFQLKVTILYFLASFFLLNFSFTDWTGKDKDEQDISVWEDNWEDDNIEDDFNKQLRYIHVCFRLFSKLYVNNEIELKPNKFKQFVYPKNIMYCTTNTSNSSRFIIVSLLTNWVLGTNFWVHFVLWSFENPKLLIYILFYS